MTQENCPWAFLILGLIITILFIIALINLIIYENKK
jgi:hypothetical protein